jgi:hypothetical protein
MFQQCKQTGTCLPATAELSVSARYCVEQVSGACSQVSKWDKWNDRAPCRMREFAIVHVTNKWDC